MEDNVGFDVPLSVCNYAARLAMSHRFVQSAARSKQLLCPASQFQSPFLFVNGADLALVSEMLFLQNMYR